MNHKGQALKKAIEQTKTTKSDLIKRLGISVPTFYSWLNKKDLSDDKINRVTKALGGSASKAGSSSKKQAAKSGTGSGHKGQALKMTIEQANATKSDLIKKLGISVPTFYSWLKNRNLSDDKINRVTKALGNVPARKAGSASKKSAKVEKKSAAAVSGAGHKGKALKKTIEQTKTKKSDLIRRLGISVPTFYSWLNKRDLSDDKINRVTSALGSGAKVKAARPGRKPGKVAKAAPASGGNGVVSQINDLQRIIINLQQHLIDSLRGGSKPGASSPAKKTRRRRRKKSAAK